MLILQINNSEIRFLIKKYKYLSQSVRECPKILKICQITKFDMGFQKNNILGRYKKVDFFIQAIFSDSFTINPKKNVNIRDIFKVEVENKKLIELNVEENKDDDVIEVV